MAGRVDHIRATLSEILANIRQLMSECQWSKMFILYFLHNRPCNGQLIVIIHEDLHGSNSVPMIGLAEMPGIECPVNLHFDIVLI